MRERERGWERAHWGLRLHLKVLQDLMAFPISPLLSEQNGGSQVHGKKSCALTPDRLNDIQMAIRAALGQSQDSKEAGS